MRSFEVLKLFLYIGIVAFGGPAAHIAIVHREIVERRGWIDEEHFLDLIGATALIPGPNSTEMVIHCGHHRAGLPGLFIAGISFILPAFILTLLLAIAYVKYSYIPEFESLLIGIKPVVVLLIFDATRKLWKKAIKSGEYIAISVVVFGLSLSSIGEFWALSIGAILGFFYFKLIEKKNLYSVEPISIFLIFFKIGAILFGSGYVLIAYLQDEIVNNRQWITSLQLADAIGIGQFTPGPVLTTATFIGYLLGDVQGALLATIGIFLPSFLFVWVLGKYISKMRDSKNFSMFLNCINAGTIGMMIFALYSLGKITFSNNVGIITFVILSAIYLKFPKINSILLVIISLALGLSINAGLG